MAILLVLALSLIWGSKCRASITCSVDGRLSSFDASNKWSFNSSKLIFVRRMRKAGSTTLRAFFAKVQKFAKKVAIAIENRS